MPDTETLAPFEVVHLAAAAEELRQGETWKDTGHNAKTLLRGPDLRLVLISMKACDRIREHKTGERVTIHTVSGHVRVHVAKGTLDLPVNTMVILEPSLEHDVEALVDSSILMTITWPHGPGGTGS